MQLNESLDKYAAEGLGVVALSYDSVEILQSFDDRMGGIDFPMLADPNSEIIEAYGIRNPNPAPGSRTDGMAFPGTYIVDTNGVVIEKFFENSHRIRPTAETILMKTFGADGGRRTEVQLPQFSFAAYASQDDWRPGNTVVLVIDFELPDRMHLYAPGSDYTAVELNIVESEHVLQGELSLPDPEILYLEAIDETVPVWFDAVQIQRDITLSPGFREDSLAVDAILSYQTCDDDICYPPADFELTFNFDVIQNDRQRAPEAVRHPGE